MWYKREALPPLVIAEMTDANSAGQHQAPVVLQNSKKLSVPNWCTLGMMYETSPQIITDYSGNGEDDCRNWGTETRPLLFPLLGSVFQHRFYRFMFLMVRVGACLRILWQRDTTPVKHAHTQSFKTWNFFHRKGGSTIISLKMPAVVQYRPS